MKRLVLALFAFASSLSIHSATLSRQWQVNDTNLLEYFRRETRAIADKCLTDLTTSNAWLAQAPQRRAELAEMLGLSPMPERTDLKATVTKSFDAGEFTVENLHFQSRPGLYVTANLYIPKGLTKPAPTVLYVCGHSPVITNKVSYGTKAAYQHWGSWFARNGYVCMILDTLESGEILGEHHGTYSKGIWWWNSRGYTPAGVECWNGMRALDYLSTRPEVDTNRFGVTGRSGGGAYSWYVTAMDERIKASAPTAGITDLENHVLDGAVEGHCDCMFFVNTYRWDYPQLAAMAAPRPLLIVNTDDDAIFPLDGVVRLRDKVRRVYDLFGAGEKCGLVIGPGGHKDTQDIQVPVMRWFNKHLKGADTPVENVASRLFSPQQLKVFETLPADAVNGTVYETFVPQLIAAPPSFREDWTIKSAAALSNLTQKCFRARLTEDARADALRDFLNPTPSHFLPVPSAVFAPERFVDGLLRDRKDENQESKDWVRGQFIVAHSPDETRLTYVRPAKSKPKLFVVRISMTNQPPAPEADTVVALMPIRAGAVVADAKKQTQIRRRFMLLGGTLDSMRVSDIIHTIRATRSRGFFDEALTKLPLRLEAEGDMAVNALYASLFASVDELVLTNLPKSHQDGGPDYLNVLRFMDIPQAVAMASERCRVELRGARAADWQYSIEVARQLGREGSLRIVE